MQISALQDLIEQAAAYQQAGENAEANAHNPKTLTLMSLAMRQTRFDMELAKQRCGDDPPDLPDLVGLMDDALKKVQAGAKGDLILHENSQRERDTKIIDPDPWVISDHLDKVLPVRWDYREDAIILVGDGMAGVKNVLQQLGQQRFIEVHDTEEDEEYLYKKIREFKPRAPRGWLLLSAKDGVGDDLVQRAKDAVRDIRVFGNTMVSFGGIWVRNGIKNLQKMATIPPVYMMGSMFRNYPMLVVAPGPSLDKNIELVKKFKNKALIVTMSHALKILQDNGVDPDLIVTVDSQDLTYHFKDCDTSRSAMLSGITCDPKLFELPAIEHFYCGANASADAWLLDDIAEMSLLSAGGSVATSCVALGVNLGCNPIIAIGLDCATPGGRMYSKDSHDAGVTARVDKDEKGNDVIKIGGWSDDAGEMMGDEDYSREQDFGVDYLPAYDGEGEVPTTAILKMFHSWFQAFAGVKTQDGFRFINATEGGAKIENWDNMRLERVFEIIKIGDERHSIPRWRAVRKSPKMPELKSKCIKRSNRLHQQMKKSKTILNKLINALDAGDLNRVEALEKRLAEVNEEAGVFDTILYDTMHAVLDRIYTARTAHVCDLTAKEFYLIMRDAAEFALQCYKEIRQ